MDLEHIFKSIDSLSPLSDAVLQVQKLFAKGQEDLEISELIAIIESDSVLSLHVLKMANSPLYGFSSKIASVSQAVTLFGIMQIYGFIMKYAVSENIKARTEVFGFSNERFNDICNIQSALLIQWYGKIDLKNAQFLSPLALIMETGKLIVAQEVSSTSYEQEFEQGFRKSKNISKFEKVLLGITSYDLSSKVFQHWHLEPMYINVLHELEEKEYTSKTIEHYVKILKIIITAVNLKSVLSKESVLEACQMVRELGCNPEEFAQVALYVKRAYVSELKVRRESPI